MAPTSFASAARRARCMTTRADLLSVERLREAGGCGRLHAAQPHQREEGVFAEPVLVALRGEALHDGARLLLRGRRVERDEKVRRAEVGVVLRDLVFEDQVVAEGVPGELRDRAVV